ncbi:protein of unknown function [Kyrpidia spormannii]|uniref:Uncharacterized protein n=1 Tax=Kyrpidia spormannii TaxID=2055160 RepID=A0ACA8ZEQ0_9BACL|nr:protein of unknown function [Kyrpidia spormannii]
MRSRPVKFVIQAARATRDGDSMVKLEAVAGRTWYPLALIQRPLGRGIMNTKSLCGGSRHL